MNQFEWDKYYLKIAKKVSENTKCMSRKVGAVLVKNNSIISAGYNGASAGVKHCNERNINFYKNIDKRKKYLTVVSVELNDMFRPKICPRKILQYKSGQGLHLCQAGHAERNAIIQAAKNGISTLEATLYCYCSLPCKDCMIEIINAGIKELVYLEGTAYDEYSEVLLKESNIKVRTVKKEEIE